MSYCINPQCLQPDRHDNQGAYCNSCGTALVLNGRYRVQRSLTNTEAAESGFGYIYEILEGSQLKILKVLIHHHNSNPKAVELFQQEASVLQQFQSQGIPKIDCYFQHKTKVGMTLHCIVMEKIDGDTLEQWIQKNRNQPIGEKLAIVWLEEIVRILALVHSKNYFHRDIKPANIMLRRTGELVLIDFGTARDMAGSYLQKQGEGKITRISSEGYTPPEQSQGTAVLQSDFFALGRTFAQLLTAKEPSKMYIAATDEFRWRQHTQDVLPDFLDLIDKMMARRPIDRHQSTSELLRDIAKVQKSIQNKKTSAQVVKHQGLGRRDLFLLLGGSSFVAIVAWEKLKPKPAVKVDFPSPSIPPTSNPTALETPRSSQNEPIPSSTASSQLQTQTLNNIITVDSSGKEINRRTVQVQYFAEDKIGLPSGARAIEMALIPAGNFTIGSPSTEKDRSNDESPQQSINFARSFYMSRYEVTQKQWFTVMGSDYDANGFKKRFGELDNKFKGDNRPIVAVDWNDAKAYCKKLSELTGKNYRLPSESEWEYSCRAKTTTPFYFGETITADLVNHDSNYPYANVAKNSSGYRQVTTDVGSFPSNEWGLYDMHGNVWEWCEDVWHDNYNGIYNGIPNNGSAWLNGGEQNRHIVRGCSWFNTAYGCRSAFRSRLDTVFRHYGLGFRVVL